MVSHTVVGSHGFEAPACRGAAGKRQARDRHLATLVGDAALVESQVAPGARCRIRRRRQQRSDGAVVAASQVAECEVCPERKVMTM